MIISLNERSGTAYFNVDHIVWFKRSPGETCTTLYTSESISSDDFHSVSETPEEIDARIKSGGEE